VIGVGPDPAAVEVERAVHAVRLELPAGEVLRGGAVVERQRDDRLRAGVGRAGEKRPRGDDEQTCHEELDPAAGRSPCGRCVWSHSQAHRAKEARALRASSASAYAEAADGEHSGDIFGPSAGPRNRMGGPFAFTKI